MVCILKPSIILEFCFQILISFSQTIGTRVRLSLLRSVSKRQKDKNPNAVCSVSSFTPRPMLRVGGGKDQGTRFLSFVDAMLGFHSPPYSRGSRQGSVDVSRTQGSSSISFFGAL